MDNHVHVHQERRFLPSDVELIHHLKQWLEGKLLDESIGIHFENIYKDSPWNLPMFYKHGPDCQEPRTYYITRRIRATKSGRVSRTAGCGRWDCQSTVKDIEDGGQVVGHKEQFTFRIGKGRKDNSTGWILHEYLLAEKKEFQDWALYSLYKKKERRKKPSLAMEGLQNLENESDISFTVEELESIYEPHIEDVAVTMPPAATSSDCTSGVDHDSTGVQVKVNLRKRRRLEELHITTCSYQRTKSRHNFTFSTAKEMTKNRENYKPVPSTPIVLPVLPVTVLDDLLRSPYAALCSPCILPQLPSPIS